jgi:hypothetical protein
MSQPAEKIREGNVSISIWENQGPKGAFRTAAIQLRYRDEKKEWHDSKSFGTIDLENLEKAAKKARESILSWNQRNKPTREPGIEG